MSLNKFGDVVYIDFFLEEYSEHNDTDACCKISSEIGATGLMYGVDFWFHESYTVDSEHIIKFGFKDKHEAMLLKLAGVTKLH
jgi:hypothetical protein